MNNITYDILNKASKKDLIAWMKHNVLLPNITDEDFLNDIKLRALLKKEKELLTEDRKLNDELENTKNNPYKSLSLMAESEKLQNKMQNVSDQITHLLDIKN